MWGLEPAFIAAMMCHQCDHTRRNILGTDSTSDLSGELLIRVCVYVYHHYAPQLHHKQAYEVFNENGCI